MDQFNIKEILGHEEISPGRKTDPGPAFAMEALRKRTIGKHLPKLEKGIGYISVDTSEMYDKEDGIIIPFFLRKGVQVEILKKFKIYSKIEYSE